MLWPTELKRRVGKQSISRRYDLIPLLRSSPGGFKGSWPYRTYPFCRCKGSTFFLFYKLLCNIKLLPAKSLRRQKKRNGIYQKNRTRKTSIIEEKGASSETELRHQAYALCPASLAVTVLAFAEVVLATHLDARGDVPEHVERTIQAIPVHATLGGMVG